jgi:hypothetical protein
MLQILAQKNPHAFKTQSIQVEASAQQLIYRPFGLPLSFGQMQERRRPLEVQDSLCFCAELANLGVSVRLTLNWQGRDYWVLVRQQRADRGDTVLKLISGYVNSQELLLPLRSALQEVSEECLVSCPSGWLSGRYGEHWLQQPYLTTLDYHDDHHFQLTPRSGAARSVIAGNLPLLERPRAYVHQPTASLQLVYDMRLELPDGLDAISLFHADEQLEEQRLVACLKAHPDLFLLPCDNPDGELFTLQAGQLQKEPPEDLWLSESFAPQDGWLIRDERIRWHDWMAGRRTH